MSITHIEDVPVNKLISYLDNIQDFIVTEKIDGSNLQFGIDEKGFFTSRGDKGNNIRYRSVEDYCIDFTTTFQRFAHSALMQALPALQSAGLSLNDCVEIEVLLGTLPNTVPYDGRDRIVFLRTINGSVNLNDLQQAVVDETYHFILDTPVVKEPQLEIYQESMHYTCVFALVPEHTVTFDDLFDTIAIVNVLKIDLARQSGIISGMTNSDITEIPLNKKPLHLREGDNWSDIKKEIRLYRESVAQLVIDIKDKMMHEYLRDAKSKIGPQDSTGWIEGVVFRHKITSEQFKLVDKSRFTRVNKHTHVAREQIRQKAQSVNKANMSIMGTTYWQYAALLGMTELGTIQAKRLIRKGNFKSNKECLISLAAEVTNKSNNSFCGLRELIKKSLFINRCKLIESYNAYKLERHTVLINGVRLLEAEIKKRTINTYAIALYQIDIMLTQVHSATNTEQLIEPLIKQQLNELFNIKE